MYQYVVASENYVLKFEELVNKRTDVGMAYGRLEIDPDNFLDEAIIAICTIDSVATIPDAHEHQRKLTCHYHDERQDLTCGYQNSI